MNILNNKNALRVMNAVITLYHRVKRTKSLGLLPDRKDDRDFGWSLFKREYEKSPYARFGAALDDLYIFNQNPFNICVFASLARCIFLQEGIRVSTRGLVIMSLNKIGGNGWSYLRAGLETVTEKGAPTYEFLPDETDGQSWQQYISYIGNKEELYKNASLHKFQNYQVIKNQTEAETALEAGYALLTGLDWWSGMFNPSAPEYTLVKRGYYIAGHAIAISRKDDFGYVKNGQNRQNRDSDHFFFIRRRSKK